MKNLTRMIASRVFLIILVLQVSTLISNFHPDFAAADSGEAIPTYLTAWPDHPFYLEGWPVQLEVSIWDEYGQPIVTGEVRVSDLDGSTDTTTTVSGYPTLINWFAAMDGLARIHRFEITYNDQNNHYNASSTVIELLIGEQEITSGEIATALDPSSAEINMAKGQAVSVSGIMTSRSTVFPYFYIDPETAFLSVEAEIGGVWKILSVSYPSTGITSAYNFDLPFALPPWLPTGQVPGHCVFSGSASSDLANTTTSFTINLLSREKSLVFLPEQLSVERNNLTEQNTFPVTVQVPGFDSDPVMVNIDLLSGDDSLVVNLLVNHPLTDYSSQLFLEFPQNIAIGTYNLLAILIDQQTGAILASDSAPVTVTDDLIVDNFYWNVTDRLVIPGQSIRGYLVTREEDTFLAVKSDLKVLVEGTGAVLLDTITDDNGYISFSITVPGDFLPGAHGIVFAVSPLPADKFHLPGVKTLEVIVQQETTIVHQESSVLVRQQEGWFNASVIDDEGLPVTAGTLSLTMNGNHLYSSATSTANYRFSVPVDAPRGINFFQWCYVDGGIYKDRVTAFPLAIHSTPSFTNLSPGSMEIFPEQETVITGQLVEETGEPVIGAKINISHRDNWGVSSSYQVLTDGEGIFSFTFTSEEGESGTHIITVEFNGWLEEHYLPVPGKLVFEVSVSPPISLSVNEELVAGKSAILKFQGKPSQEITLEIFEVDNWVELDIITLDSGGSYGYNWTIPDHLRGEILVRASYIENQYFALFTLNIKVNPLLDVQVSKSLVMTGEETIIAVSCSENHGIWLDGEPWVVGLSPGSRQYTLVFAETGDHELKVEVSGETVVTTVKKAIIQVREDYTITVNLSRRIQSGTDTKIEVIILDGNQQPLEGFIVNFLMNESLIATSITSQTGRAILSLSLMKGFYMIAFKITPRDSLVHASKEFEYGDLTVYSVPSIEILDLTPVRGKLVAIRAKITVGYDPVVGENVFFRLRSIPENIDDFIGNNITDSQGRVELAWNVTQESRDYFLYVENQGSNLLESIIVTKAIHVLEKAPEFVQAEMITQNNNQNLYLITAAVSFPGGKGSVNLYRAMEGDKLGELQENGNYWILTIQLERGSHDLWLQAVDAAGIESWHNLGTVEVLNNVQNDPKAGKKPNDDPLLSMVKDTLLSMIFLLPVAGIIVYKKRKNLFRA
ncbi:MAG: carboxypeptidase-like regulatory domain-containing protein [Candidatus Odinarchaeota archaeon]